MTKLTCIACDGNFFDCYCTAYEQETIIGLYGTHRKALIERSIDDTEYDDDETSDFEYLSSNIFA